VTPVFAENALHLLIVLVTAWSILNITLTKASMVMSVPVDSSDTQYYKELKELALFL
jgi:hypothetical protein